MSKLVDPKALLAALGPAPVSGEALAKQFRISRPAVWKHIRYFQAMGLPIKSLPRLGYAFDVAPDFSLLQARADAYPAWTRVRTDLSVNSTQSLARQAAEAGAPEGNVYVAEVQKTGRGRLGRAWNSGFGGLWFSLVLRPQGAYARMSSLGLIASYILAQTIHESAGINVRLKWPNDLLLAREGGWRKVAGFLTEMSGEMDRVDWAILGVGLNVRNPIPAELTGIAANLQDVVPTRSLNRAELLGGFLKRFGDAYAVWQRKGFAPFREPYWNLYAKPHQPVRLKTAEGHVSGIARGVDDSGALIIESKSETRSVLEGEIVL